MGARALCPPTFYYVAFGVDCTKTVIDLWREIPPISVFVVPTQSDVCHGGFKDIT